MSRAGRAIDWAAARARLAESRQRLVFSYQDDPVRREALLDERARMLRARRRSAAARVAHEDVLAVRVGDAKYGLPLAPLAGVVRNRPVTPPIGASTALLGTLYERGEFWSVYALGVLLAPDHAADPVRTNDIVLLREPRHRLGLAVEALEGTRRIDPERLSAPPGAAAGRSLIRGIADDSLPILDVALIRRHAALGGETE